MAKAIQLALGTRLHNNQQLFSDHFLNEVLPGMPDWQALEAQAEPAMRTLQTLFNSFVSGNEAQTEEGLIRPILRVLGHVYEVQPSLRTPEGHKTPDYALYTDEVALTAHRGQILTDVFPREGGLAVADAKQWDRSLDHAMKGGSDALSNKSPSYQIYYYMVHSQAEWGILTNGRLWRLYHKTTAHKLDHYYEVDLPSLLSLNDVPAFLYFFGIFSRGAFHDGPLSLTAMLQESADYARGVSETLKTQVYEGLRHIAQGFLDYTPNGLHNDPATLKQIYSASLILLYRLLFVLYSEDRSLLPVWENDQYRDSYSLRALKYDIARNLDVGRRLRPTSALLWPRLRELFRIINEGDPPLNVTTFNGGLFDAKKHPFLEQYTVGDAHLQQAVDMLARVQGQMVDYRDLAVRHLGSIYEGLLEYHVVAIEPEQDGLGGQWTVALVTDKGERHATGSYYTPDWVVQFIVDRTVGPVLREKTEGLQDEEAIAQAVLTTNILDPACGSAHFLVECVDYVARFLVERGIRTGGPESISDAESDLATWKRRVASACVYGVDLNPLAVELGKLSLWLATVAKGRPLNFLDHHIRTGNSLVGSWIRELTEFEGGVTSKVKGTGGKTARQQKEAAALEAAGVVQLSMMNDEAFTRALGAAVDVMATIESTPGETIEQVKQQERLYGQLREELNRKYGQLADIAASKHFGLNIRLTKDEKPFFVDYVTGRTFMPAMPQFAQWVQEAEKLDTQHHYFHWELEFPEIWFRSDGTFKAHDAGFDAVVGNPPYVRQEVIGPYKPHFQTAFRETYDGVADLYVYFYQQGLRLCRPGGFMSYIVTNKWLRAGYGAPLRAYFASQAALEELIDFGHAAIFEGADVFPCILVLRKQSDAGEDTARDSREVQVTNVPREALSQINLAGYVAEHNHRIPLSRFGKDAWVLENAEVDGLLSKMRSVGVPLAQFAGARPYRGILTGLNEIFLVDSKMRQRLVDADPGSATVFRPYLRGQDMGRWVPEWEGLYLVCLKSSGDYEWPWSADPETAEQVFNDTFPALYAYMKPLEDKLRLRQDKGRYWWELRSCAYYSAFDRPKVMYQEIQFHPHYGFDTAGLFTNNKGFFLPTDDLWILAVLNSPLMWWHNWRYLPHMKDEALSPVANLMESVPIARPPSAEARNEAVTAVQRLMEIRQARNQARRVMLDWLHIEFAIETLGQRLEAFEMLSAEDFLEEVRKRRPRTAGRLTPAALKDLRTGYSQQAEPLRQEGLEAVSLEGRLATLVNEAYGLTSEEVELLWETAPPRMPISKPY